ncbi:MAG: type I restriction enzyme HsdR N-terminal domain-containing protein, partial [Spirosomaceae bacterium]|nr:type I restriction enzyme HsdR N-terminal domain-containing protein [Spirosomataceae bacterium]
MKIPELPVLTLPKFDYKITESDGKSVIFDIIRKKNIVLTPEEWVRQHVIHLLIANYGYSRGLFQVEKGTSYNSLQKRTDIVVYNREGSPHLLVECKAPEIKINQYVVEQASR